jgi:hypothetical protein
MLKMSIGEREYGLIEREVRNNIADMLEATTGYEVEWGSGGSETVIPKWIAIGIARGNK